MSLIVNGNPLMDCKERSDTLILLTSLCGSEGQSDSNPAPLFFNNGPILLSKFQRKSNN